MTPQHLMLLNNKNVNERGKTLFSSALLYTKTKPPLYIRKYAVFIHFLTLLRTVHTKYKGFCGKSRSLQGLLESTKKNRGSHAFFRDN